MSKSLEIVSWNLRDGLNDSEVQTSILDTEPDLAVFPEGHAEGVSLAAGTVSRFHNAGYDIYDKTYDDNDGRKDRRSLVVIAKPELVSVAHSVYVAGRHAIRLTLEGGTQFMGVHLDDRGEKRRLAQAEVVVRSLGETAIVAGDFNDMYRNVGQAPLLRLARPLNVLHSRDPESGRKSSKLSYAQRLNGMARGKVMQLLAEADFEDAGSDHTPTMVEKVAPGVVIKAQLDHIMYRGNVAVKQQTIVEDADNLSDHKRIRATLIITQ